MNVKAETLFYQDNKLFDFTAKVTSCAKTEKGFAITLDRTAFFPEAGGQYGDVGTIDDVRIFDTQEEDDVIHYAESPIEVGKIVECKVEPLQRLKKMRDHTGEHILSSVVHRKFGYDNVGFHLAPHSMDVDFNGEFTKEELKEIELEVNSIIRENVEVKCYFPDKETLANIEYRSKLELEAPRIVEITGYDYCACCAPHASTTGEVGYLTIVDSCRNRGNTRLTVLCGEDACEYAAKAYLSSLSAAQLLSATPLNIGEAVAKQVEKNEELRNEIQRLKYALVEMQANELRPTDDFLVIFTEAFALKDMVNKGLTLAKKGVCAFSKDGNERSYMIASETTDVRDMVKALNLAFDGKGGGRPNAAQGKLNGAEEDIRAFIENYARS